ncbi:NAD(P)-binding protein [Ramicandelaber brevisporus]|nr:NAD(P)-binding protein [Ramicandelaber brevisporus]
MSDIRGKVVVVTGAAAGFGQALTEHLVSAGAKVVLGDINIKDGQRLADHLNLTNRAKVATFRSCDVTKTNELQALLSAAVAEFGGMDVWVNNAGVGYGVNLFDEENPKGSWRKMLDINLTAVVDGTRIAISYFLKHDKPGTVINVASSMAFFPLSFHPTYGVTKAGVVALTSSLAPFADRHDIHVNAVAPNFADTQLLRDEMEKDSAYAEFVTQNGLIQISSVIDAIMRCITDKSLKGDTLLILPGKKGDKTIVNTTGRKAKY